VVTVTGYDSNDQPLSRGNGYIYSANGIVVTSYSAIRGASSVTVETSRGEELTVIALMGYSPARDLAALAVLEGNLPALENGAEETVQEAEAVSALGLSGAVAQGVLGTRRAIGGVDLIGTNLQANAGSPVINRQGKVIGVVIQRNGGVFAVPSHYVSDMLAENHTMSFEQMLEETR
jgi:S1-C subfamily serine protease